MPTPINPYDLIALGKQAWDQTKQPLKERGTVLPIGEYEDGSVGMAWPGLLAAPVEGVMNFGSRGYGEDAVPYNAMNAFDAAGGAMTGGLATGLAGGMVDNALGSAGGRIAQAAERQGGVLASRDIQMQARALGYDPQRLAAWADDQISTLTPSRWQSDQAEALRLQQLKSEIAENPGALQGIREAERMQVEAGHTERASQITSRPIAERGGYRIERRDDPYSREVKYEILSDDGSSIGSGTLTGAGNDIQPQMDWVSVADAHKRKGIASWLYDEVERDIGRPLWPSPELISPEIQAFWQKRDPDRLARMRAGTYANAPTGASIPLGLEAQQETDQPPYGMTPEEYENAGFFAIMAAATKDGIRKGQQRNETNRQNEAAGLETMVPRKGARGTQSGTAPPEWADTAGGYGDAYYLPKEPLQEIFGEKIGDQIYRNQGVALHGALGLAALPLGPAASLPNLGYAAYSYLTGRTQPRPTGFWEPSDQQTYIDAGARGSGGFEAQQETDVDPALMEVLRQYGLMPSN